MKTKYPIRLPLTAPKIFARLIEKFVACTELRLTSLIITYFAALHHRHLLQHTPRRRRFFASF